MQRRFLPLLLLFLLFTLHCPAQFWMQFGGSNTIDEALDVGADATGNIYTTGYFTGNASFSTHTAISAGVDDIFLYKLDAAGLPQWVKRAGGTASDKGLALDASGTGIAVTGYFSGTAVFDAQAVTSAGQQDIFIALYDAAGALQWVASAGGTGFDAGNGVAVDATGNVIVTGEFTGTCTFGSVTLTSAAGSVDVFTAKYSAAGLLLWAKKGSGLLTDRGLDVETDATGNIYVSGACSDTVTFDFTHNNSFSNAIFLIKYNAAGQEQWFRWMGSNSTARFGGLDVNGSAIGLAGSLTGTMYFFGGTGFPTLVTTQTYNLFLCRYDTAGNYLWSHADGSSSDIDVSGFALQASGDQVVSGSFKCRFSDFSVQYGDGTFCSLGFWDSFVSAYDNNGTLGWARNFGSRSDDVTHSLCLQGSRPVVVGSFEDRLISTCNPANYLGYGTSNILGSGAYCSDNEYFRYVSKLSGGNKDVYINNNFDLSRQPFDYFYRAGFACVRDFNDVCISGSQASILACVDTVTSCAPLTLNAVTNAYINRGPNWTYLWSNGTTASSVNASASGDFWVTVTSADGCFTQSDTAYFNLLPFPDVPLVSDDKGINTATSTPVDIQLCAPDSVQLNCTNPGSNTIQWTGFPPGANPVMVTVTGDYTCLVTNAAGCSRSTMMHVDIYEPLDTLLPKMMCVEDTDFNDTIEICVNDFVSILAYDSLTNPLASLDSCIENLTFFIWDTTGLSTYFNFSTISLCPTSANSFTATQPGSFTFVFSVDIIRETVCDSDTVTISRPFHVIINPIPTISNFPLTITASDTVSCPGSPILLVASGSTNYEWTDPSGTTISTDDSVVVFNPGSYTVSSDTNITNSFGCSAEVTSAASILITSYPQPSLSMVPADGIACPNDSVQIICSGAGNSIYNWQGPGGAIANPDSSLYATVFGSYFCIVTVAPGCTLVTNTLQILPYNNPIILAFPTPSLCDNNPIELTVVSNIGSLVQWQPPLSGSSPVQVVSDTGTYLCNVTSCGILTPLSYTVIRDTALALITTAGAPEFCAGDSLLLTANTGMSQYLWLPSGDTTTFTYVSTGGSDTLITQSQFGCKDTAVQQVTEIPNTLTPPSAADSSVCFGLPVTLVASGFDTILWAYTLNYADTFSTGQSLFIPAVTAPIRYYLYTLSGLCKSAFDSVEVLLDDCNEIDIPNVITPGGDNLNDFFPGGSGNYVFDLKIYNRWGGLVFETTNSTIGWAGQSGNGQNVPDGTYYYLMTVTFTNQAVEHFKGSLMVLNGK